MAMIGRYANFAKSRRFKPYPAYKDSGVEWLGEIPAHWGVRRLKHLLRRQKGAIKTGPFGSHLNSAKMLAGDIKTYNHRSVLDRDFARGRKNPDFPDGLT